MDTQVTRGRGRPRKDSPDTSLSDNVAASWAANIMENRIKIDFASFSSVVESLYQAIQPDLETQITRFEFATKLSGMASRIEAAIAAGTDFTDDGSELYSPEAASRYFVQGFRVLAQPELLKRREAAFRRAEEAKINATAKPTAPLTPTAKPVK